MQTQPNLFQYAPSELSQDAIICWLLAWADNSQTGPIHKCGLLFLNSLLMLHGHDPIIAASVSIKKQFKNTDVIAEIDDDIVILIEDKTNALEHGKQLEMYVAAIAAEYPTRKLLPVFLKTGDQSNYSKAIAAGYKLLKRSDFITVLQSSEVSSDIATNFLSYLKEREKAVREYESKNHRDWSDQAWTGFYMGLQEKIIDIEWGYVSNRAGGFMAAWWHTETRGDWSTYLQIEQGKLCFKISANQSLDTAARAVARDYWSDKLQKSAAAAGQIGLKRPSRFGNGQTMTIAELPAADWLMTDDEVGLDMEKVINRLKNATAVMDAA